MRNKSNIFNKSKIILDEINNIIATNCYTEEDKLEDNVIMGDDFSKLADDLVKFCNLHYVGVSKAQEYAEFCVECDRKGLPLLEYEGWVYLDLKTLETEPNLPNWITPSLKKQITKLFAEGSDYIGNPKVQAVHLLHNEAELNGIDLSTLDSSKLIKKITQNEN